MDKTMEQIKQLAHRYHVKRLVLFGSRARGDHHARSDYDFAVWGCDAKQRILFQDAVENDVSSLHSIDLVFINENTDAALLYNIEKDGICLLDRYQTKFDNFFNAVQRLEEGLQAYHETPVQIIRDGVIQRFEFTCELAWKTTREFLLDQGFTDLNSPKATMRKAFSYGLIDDEDAWIALLNARNQTSHIYEDATAQEIYDQIDEQYVTLFLKLIEQLRQG